MELITGNLDLLYQDISMLEEELNCRNSTSSKKDILLSLHNKAKLLYKVNGDYITIQFYYIIYYNILCKRFIKSMISDFISKKEENYLFSKDIISVLKDKDSEIATFDEYSTFSQAEMIDLMKDYMDKEHSNYYKSFIDFLSDGRIFLKLSNKNYGVTLTDMIFNNHNVITNKIIKNDVSFMTTLIHEFAHTVDANNLLTLLNKDFCSTELLSIKWEREFIEYLLENNIQLDNSYTHLNKLYKVFLKKLIIQEYLGKLPKRFLKKERYLQKNKIGVNIAKDFNKLVYENNLECDFSLTSINRILPYTYSMAIGSYLMVLRNEDKEQYLSMSRKIEKERLENKSVDIKSFLDIIDCELPMYVSKDLDMLINGSNTLQKGKMKRK